MKTCKKCGCVYDNSFDKCPTCNYTINKEINKELFRGCLNGLIIFISIIMSISSSSAFPFILGIIICIIISSRKFAINTNQNENNTINLHLKNNVTLHETFCASLKKELTEKQKENKEK